MQFMYLWPLALLLFIPVVIIMYLLKQKAVPHDVPSLFLWKEMYQNRESDTPWEKLKKNTLLIIQIITILALIFALMGPYFSVKAEASGAVVLIIDNSGSMNTMVNGSKKTRLESAKSVASEYVTTLPEDTVVSVIACSDSATTVIANAKDRTAIRNAIYSISGTNRVGDNCAEAISLCQGLAAGNTSLSVVAFTDDSISMGTLSGTIYSFLESVENVCVDYVSSAEKNGLLSVIVGLTNCGSNTASGDLNLYGDGEMLAVKSYTIAPGESTVVYFEGIYFEGKILSAEINTPDALSSDNTAFCLNNLSNAGKVLLVTDKNSYLEKAVSLKEGVTLIKTNDVETLNSSVGNNYDLYIFDRIIPEELPKEGNILFVNCKSDALFTSLENVQDAYVTIDESPYTQNISREKFGVTDTMVYNLPIWATSLLSVESGTVGFVGEYEGRKIGAIGFDLHNTDFGLKLQYPVFMYNVISYLSDTSAISSRENYCGDQVRILNTANSGKLSILSPDQKSETFTDSLVKYTGTEQIGVYTINKGKTNEEQFVVNFNSAESRSGGISQANLGESKNAIVVDGTRTTTKSYRPFIIIVILLIMAVEWIVYIRD